MLAGQGERAEAQAAPEPSGADPVVHDVAVRSHPVVRGDLDVEMPHAFGRHQTAPGDATGEARLLRTETEGVHLGMDAVGADQRVGLGARTVVEACDHLVALLLEPYQPVAKMHPFGRDGIA